MDASKTLDRERLSKLLLDIVDNCSTRDQIDRYLNNDKFPGESYEREILQDLIPSYYRTYRPFGFTKHAVNHILETIFDEGSYKIPESCFSGFLSRFLQKN